MKEIGELLRGAREAKGINIRDAQEATKIRSKYLLALEEGKFDVIPPGEVYLRGFIRTYAEFLGLDPSEIMGRYDAIKAMEEAQARRESEEIDKQGESRIQGRAPGRVRWLFGGTIGLIVLMIAVAVALHWGGRPSAENDIPASGTAQEAPQEVQNQSAPAKAEPAPAEPADAVAASQHSIAIEVTDRSWIRVMADGQVVAERIFNAGESATFPYRERLTIRVGNAAGVLLTADGSPMGTMGGHGQVVERAFPVNFSAVGPE